MVTKEDIRNGYADGRIRIINSPTKDGVVFKVTGDKYSDWFYFGGAKACDVTPDQYVRNVPLDEIINEIYDAIAELEEGYYHACEKILSGDRKGE